jgi:type VI secretion system secreted protein VgrG
MASPLQRKLVDQRFDFSSRATDENGTAYDFAVVEMEGFEALSQPFRFTLTLVSEDAGIDAGAMLLNPATFTIYGPGGHTAVPYHGVLAEFDQLHSVDGYVFYSAVLVPRLWNLSLYRLSEVYVDEQPVTKTMTSVLKQAGMTADSFEFRLTGDYRSRSFVCQYEETYLEFLSRRMENEGIYYWFDHTGDADQLIAVDHLRMHSKDPAASGELRVVPVAYRPVDRMDTGVSGNTVRQFVCRRKPLPREVILLDFNHRSVLQELRTSAPVDNAGCGQVMLYGENFRDIGEGQRYAKLRAEELLCGGTIFLGEGSAVGLRAGYFAKLSAHYRDDFNNEYLVTEVHHRGSQAGALLNALRVEGIAGAGGETSYSNSFRAIRSDVQFRPERNTPKPRVSGTMHALVDGEGSGQYAELDEYGQYKVQLPFDLSPKNPNKASARVRMASPYTGSDHGMHFPLLKGAEVLLSFTDGDPDRPVIVGAVPNVENRNVVNADNPKVNQITTAGGNQIHMDDSDGKQVMFLHSPFHNSTFGIGSVDPNGGGSILSMTAGANETMTVGRTNAITLGMANSITGGYKFTIDASVAGRVSLGSSTHWGYSRSISWSSGTAVSVGDTAGLTLKKSDTLAANGTVRIAGGQSTLVADEVDAIKTAVKVAVAASSAAQVAAGVAAGVALTEMEDKEKDNAWNKLSDAAKLQVAQSGGVTAAAAKAQSLSGGDMYKPKSPTPADVAAAEALAAAATNAEFADYNSESSQTTWQNPPLKYSVTTEKDTLSSQQQSQYHDIRLARGDGEVAAVAMYKATAIAADAVGAPSGSQWGPTGTKGMMVQGGLSALGAITGVLATEVINKLVSSLEAKFITSNGSDYGGNITVGDFIRLESKDVSSPASQPSSIEIRGNPLQPIPGIRAWTSEDLHLAAGKNARLNGTTSVSVSSEGTLNLTATGAATASGQTINLAAISGTDNIRLGSGSAIVQSPSIKIGAGIPSALAAYDATKLSLQTGVADIETQISTLKSKLYSQSILDEVWEEPIVLQYLANNIAIEAEIAALTATQTGLTAQLTAVQAQIDAVSALKPEVVGGLSITAAEASLSAGISSIKLSQTSISIGLGNASFGLNPTGAVVSGTLIKLGD